MTLSPVHLFELVLAMMALAIALEQELDLEELAARRHRGEAFS